MPGMVLRIAVSITVEPICASTVRDAPAASMKVILAIGRYGTPFPAPTAAPAAAHEAFAPSCARVHKRRRERKRGSMRRGVKA